MRRSRSKGKVQVSARQSIKHYFASPSSQPDLLDMSQSSDLSDTATPSSLDLSTSSQMSDMSSMVSEPVEDSQTLELSYVDSASSQDPAPRVPQYYLDNFALILDTVTERYSFIFSETEASLLTAFRDLSEPAQRMFVRLYHRRGPWFQAAKLVYREIADTDGALAELGSKAFLTLCDLHAQPRLFTAFVEEHEQSLEAQSPQTKDTESSSSDLSALIQAHTRPETTLTSLFKLFSLEDLKQIIAENKAHIRIPPANRRKSITPKNKAEAQETIVHSLVKKGLTKTKDLSQTQLSSFFTVSTAKNSLSQTSPLAHALCKSLGKVVRLTEQALELFRLVHRLFFLDRSQDGTLLVLLGIQQVRYPQYSVSLSTARPVFHSRTQLVEYEESHAWTEVMSAAVAEGNVALVRQLVAVAASKVVEEATKDPRDRDLAFAFASRFRAGYVFARMVGTGVEALEKEGDYEEANALLRKLLDSPYHPGRRGKWWNRLALNFEHMSQKKKAYNVCIEALQDPLLSVPQRLTIEKRLERLCASHPKWKYPEHLIQVFSNLKEKSYSTVYLYAGTPLVAQTGRKNMFLTYDGENSVIVEDFALDYYRLSEGWQGVHCETGLFVTMFMLMFWDVVFHSSVADVFQTPYQEAPLDLGTDAFYYARKDLIDARVEEIRTLYSRERVEERLAKVQAGSDIEEPLAPFMARAWRENHGCRCRGVNWERASLEVLHVFAECLGGETLSTIFKVMAQDFKHFTSGMPDLFLFNLAARKAKFAEVKGPRDRLADHQRVWIDVLVSSGVQVDVCHVTEVKKSNKTYNDEGLRQQIEDDFLFYSRTIEAVKAANRILPDQETEDGLENSVSLTIKTEIKVEASQEMLGIVQASDSPRESPKKRKLEEIASSTSNTDEPSPKKPKADL